MNKGFETDNSDNFPLNLRLLCNHYKSISQVCRRAAINRQQFNKYLSGKSVPSRHNLRKICDFFGVEEYEIFLPHDDFKKIIRVNREDSAKPSSRAGIDPIFGPASKHSIEALEPYIGYYHYYAFAGGYAGHIVKGITSVYDDNGIICTKSIERLRFVDKPSRLADICKYHGRLIFLHDRLFLIEREYLMNNAIVMVILYPSHRKPLKLLYGSNSFVSNSEQREPSCGRIVYEYLGKNINLREAVGDCGLLSPTSDRIDDEISKHIMRDINSSDDYLFRV